MSKSDLDVVKSLYAFVAAGDFDGMRSLIHPEVTLIEPESLPYGGRYEGQVGFVDLFTQLGATWDDFSCTEFEYFIGEGAVVVTLRFKAIARKTRRPIDTRISELWRVRDGLISFLEPFYFDTHAAREAVGVNSLHT